MTRHEFKLMCLTKMAKMGLTPGEVGATMRKQAASFGWIPALAAAAIPSATLAGGFVGGELGKLLATLTVRDPDLVNKEEALREDLIRRYRESAQRVYRQQQQLEEELQRRKEEASRSHLRR